MPIKAAAERSTGTVELEDTPSVPDPSASMSPAACSVSAVKPLTSLVFGPSVIWPEAGTPALALARNSSCPVPSGVSAKVPATPAVLVSVTLPASKILLPDPKPPMAPASSVRLESSVAPEAGVPSCTAPYKLMVEELPRVKLVSPLKLPSSAGVNTRPGTPLGTSPKLNKLEYRLTAGAPTTESGASVVVFVPYSNKLPEASTCALEPMLTAPVGMAGKVVGPTLTVAEVPLDTRNTAPPPGSSNATPGGLDPPIALAALSCAFASTATLSRAASMICGPASAVVFLSSTVWVVPRLSSSPAAVAVSDAPRIRVCACRLSS